jgi:hypothetical protein
VHIAIIGAGALGRVYGARLSERATCDVTLVVRPGRVRQEPVRIERIDGDRAVDTWSPSVMASAVPKDADVVLVAVRAEQLDASLDRLLEATSAPIAVLTPMMPQDFERLNALYGLRLRAAMAGAVAYVNESGACRYWLPRMAATLIDQLVPKPARAPPGTDESPAFVDLVRTLVASGMSARLELGVHELNPATTVSIVPAAMGIDAAGGIDPLLGDPALLRLTLDAIQEGLTLAARIGKTASWIAYFMPFVGKRMLRVGASIAKSRAPEALRYVDLHFGRKLHAQNVAMAHSVLDLAKTKGTPSDAISTLLSRLEDRSA